MVLKVDGKEYKFRLADISERLAKASPEKREKYEISASGYGIHWPLIDEDLSIDGLIGIKYRRDREKRPYRHKKEYLADGSPFFAGATKGRPFDWFDKLTTGKLPCLRLAGAGRAGRIMRPARDGRPHLFIGLDYNSEHVSRGKSFEIPTPNLV